MPMFGMYPRRQTATPLPQRMPAHPAYQAPQGARTLPQNGAAPAVATPLGGGMLRQGPVAPTPPGPSMPNGYGYTGNPDMGSEFQKHITGQVGRRRMYGAADPAGPYSRYSTGNRHFGPLASRPAHVQQPVPVGTIYGGRSQIFNVDGREVGLGPNMSPGMYFGSEQARQGALGSSGVYRDTISEPNQANLASAARADDRADGLREGRRNRAIAKYGLTHLQPTQNYTYDSNIGVGGGYARTGPIGGGSIPGYGPPGPLGNLADRQASLDAAAGAQFSVASGADPRQWSGMDDVVSAFGSGNKNWSAADQQQFRKNIDARAAADPAFNKQLQEWLGQTEHLVTESDVGSDHDPQEMEWINSIRGMYGKPPLKERREYMPPQSYIPGW